MIKVLKETEHYMIKTEDVDDVCFVHIDMYKMGKGVVKELKTLLDTLMEDRQSDVCFYSKLPESFKLAEALKPLDAIIDIESEGVKAKVGIWEYN